MGLLTFCSGRSSCAPGPRPEFPGRASPGGGLAPFPPAPASARAGLLSARIIRPTVRDPRFALLLAAQTLNSAADTAGLPAAGVILGVLGVRAGALALAGVPVAAGLAATATHRGRAGHDR